MTSSFVGMGVLGVPRSRRCQELEHITVLKASSGSSRKAKGNATSDHTACGVSVKKIILKDPILATVMLGSTGYP
jgi:hypothetical protein